MRWGVGGVPSGYVSNIMEVGWGMDVLRSPGKNMVGVGVRE